MMPWASIHGEANSRRHSRQFIVQNAEAFCNDVASNDARLRRMRNDVRLSPNDARTASALWLKTFGFLPKSASLREGGGRHVIISSATPEKSIDNILAKV